MAVTLPPWDQSRTRHAAVCACTHLVVLHWRGRCVGYVNGQRCQCKRPK